MLLPVLHFVSTTTGQLRACEKGFMQKAMVIAVAGFAVRNTDWAYALLNGGFAGKSKKQYAETSIILLPL